MLEGWKGGGGDKTNRVYCLFNLSHFFIQTYLIKLKYKIHVNLQINKMNFLTLSLR